MGVHSTRREKSYLSLDTASTIKLVYGGNMRRAYDKRHLGMTYVTFCRIMKGVSAHPSKIIEIEETFRDDITGRYSPFAYLTHLMELMEGAFNSADDLEKIRHSTIQLQGFYLKNRDALTESLKKLSTK